MCSLAIGYWVPLWIYIKAMRQSPLALRDEVRKDLLRMSISGFQPANGTSINRVQEALRKWAKYAGRRDHQLRVLLKLDEPEERLQFVRRQNSIINATVKSETETNSCFRRSASQPDVRASECISYEDTIFKHEEESQVPSDARRSSLSPLSLDFAIPNGLKSPPLRLQGNNGAAEQCGPGLDKNVHYMSLSWKLQWENILNNKRHNVEIQDDSESMPSSNLVSYAGQGITDSDNDSMKSTDSEESEMRIWQRMYPVSDIVANHISATETDDVKRKSKALRFVDESKSSETKNSLNHAINRAFSTETKRCDISAFKQSIGIRSTASIKRKSRYGGGASVAPTTFGLLSSYQDDDRGVEEEEVLTTPHEIPPEFDMSSASDLRSRYERRKDRLATEYRPVACTTSADTLSTSSLSANEPALPTVPKISVSFAPSEDQNILALTKKNLQRIQAIPDTQHRTVVIKKYLADFCQAAERPGLDASPPFSVWHPALSPQTLKKSIHMSTSPANTRRQSQSNIITLSVTEPPSLGAPDCLSPTRVRNTISFKTPIESQRETLKPWMIKIYMHYRLIKCFATIPGRLERGCALSIRQPNDINQLLRICEDLNDCRIPRLMSFQRQDSTSSRGSIPVRKEIRGLVRVQCIDETEGKESTYHDDELVVAGGGFSHYYILCPKVIWFRLVVLLIRLIRYALLHASDACYTLLYKALWIGSAVVCKIESGISQNKISPCEEVVDGDPAFSDHYSRSSVSGHSDSLFKLPSSEISSSNSEGTAETRTAASSLSDRSYERRKLQRLLQFRKATRKQAHRNRPRHMNRMELTPVTVADQQLTIAMFAALVALMLPIAVIVDWWHVSQLDWGSPEAYWIVNVASVQEQYFLTDLHLGVNGKWRFFVGSLDLYPAVLAMCFFL